MRCLAIFLSIVCTLSACTPVPDKPSDSVKSQPSDNAKPQPSDSAKPQSIKVMVGLLGFFNAENPEQFKPTPINYVTVRLQDAHSAIVDHIKTVDTTNAVQVASWEETLASGKPPTKQLRDSARARAVAMLGVVDAVVQTGEVPEEQAIKLKLPAQPPANWNDEDRILTVVGLETVRRPKSRGITSALGCVWFSGKGNYLALKITAYDFTQFNTQKLADTVTKECLF